jgi:hypothetical protein
MSIGSTLTCSNSSSSIYFDFAITNSSYEFNYDDSIAQALLSPGSVCDAAVIYAKF